CGGSVRSPAWTEAYRPRPPCHLHCIDPTGSARARDCPDAQGTDYPEEVRLRSRDGPTPMAQCASVAESGDLTRGDAPARCRAVIHLTVGQNPADEAATAP